MLFRGAIARASVVAEHDGGSVRHFVQGWPPLRDARVTFHDTYDDAILVGDDVAVVTGHFASTLGAEAWALTSTHDQGASRCLASQGLDDLTGAALAQVADRIESGCGYHAPEPVWCDRVSTTYPAAALVIPVQRTPGQPGTFVNLIFSSADDAARRAVEAHCRREWPSVAAYFRLWEAARLAQRRTVGIETGLNLVAIGVVLLSGDGHIAFANETARHLMERHDGIREHRGQVQATDRGDATALSAAIGYVLAQSGADGAVDRMPLLMLRRESGPPLVTSFAAMPRSADGDDHGDGALLFFVDPGLDIHQLAEPVCKLFRLSRVETELTCLLASGQTLAAAAQALHVKLGTARGYLKQVFVKTGSNRQVDLVRLIFSNLIRASTHDHLPRR
ncbi:helix-turn-helix transcriptional regulator [Sphingomonas phyllosphaerae]|uniref:helix-turn-helix transcriptional regulator n=1 Tax=Sphingomonas phyllosphaerae TaxID=257003 RepID=UPI0012DE271D|nr:helix-turn-helix transcriptional regulator [Sphingomonas phyllosphaerae]